MLPGGSSTAWGGPLGTTHWPAAPCSPSCPGWGSRGGTRSHFGPQGSCCPITRGPSSSSSSQWGRTTLRGAAVFICRQWRVPPLCSSQTTGRPVFCHSGWMPTLTCGMRSGGAATVMQAVVARAAAAVDRLGHLHQTTGSGLASPYLGPQPISQARCKAMNLQTW